MVFALRRPHRRPRAKRKIAAGRRRGRGRTAPAFRILPNNEADRSCGLRGSENFIAIGLPCALAEDSFGEIFFRCADLLLKLQEPTAQAEKENELGLRDDLRRLYWKGKNCRFRLRNNGWYDLLSCHGEQPPW